MNDEARALLPESVRSSGSLQVGGETSQPPYLQTVDGEITGVEADFIVAVAQKLGLRPEMTNTKFVSMVPGLLSGRFDVVMGNFSDTVARQQQIDFVDYAASKQTFVVQQGNPTGISTFEELCGHSVAGPIGSKSIMAVDAQSDKCEESGRSAIEINSFPTVADAQLALYNGRVNTVPVEYALARAQVRASGSELQMVDTFYGAGLNGVGIRKGETGLSQAIVIAMTTLMKDGTYQKILDHWELSEMAIPEPTVNGAK
ncbi:ABC transporter substrate-binding protein [Rhodococcus sp. IEGM1428]|uniref:ABC transporter substrate-binding protein n=1 Tax=Rhodococcus sp. IEGM1428 TaxID=3392191 RepID=UPI003D0E18DD